MLPFEQAKALIAKYHSNKAKLKTTELKEKYKPTLYECAALSNDVYYAINDPNRPPLPEGWIRYTDSNKYTKWDKNYDPDVDKKDRKKWRDTSGYFGACYLKQTSNKKAPLCIVWAHRGTSFASINSFFKDILCDIQVYTNWFVNCETSPLWLQFNQALKLHYHTDWELLQKTNVDVRDLPNYEVGHSLGGVLSNIKSTVLSKNESITFDNPGSKFIVDYLRSHMEHRDYESAPKYSSYQADVNFINTCGEQVGNVYRLTNLGWDLYAFDKGPYLPILITPLDPYYVVYTYSQHRISFIVDYLKSNGTAHPEQSHAFGFSLGYADYLDGKARKQYWDLYSKFIFEHSINFQEDYKTLENYREKNFYPALEFTRQQVLGVQKEKSLLSDFVVVENNDDLKEVIYPSNKFKVFQYPFMFLSNRRNINHCTVIESNEHAEACKSQKKVS